MRLHLRLILSLALLAARLGGIARTPVAAAQSALPEYVVQPGDSLYSIALAFGTTVEDLQAANGIADAGSLSIGQRLVVPGLEGVSGRLDFHIVEPGETYSSVMRRYRQSPEGMARLNRVVNPSQMYVGQAAVVAADDTRPEVMGRSAWVGGAGRTLVGIAAAFGLNWWRLLDFDPVLREMSLPVPGTAVTVPGGDGALTALPWPIVEVSLRPVPPEQGRTLSILVRTAIPARVEGTIGEWRLNFVQDGDAYRALQGIDALAAPDLYLLSLSLDGDGDAPVEFSQPVNVRGGGYGFDPPLIVEPDLVDPAVVEPELAQLASVVAPVTPTRRWDGAFAVPSTGHVTSFFGTRRSFNGSAYAYFHSGTDFYGVEGTPIYAPAPGVVAFAGELKVRGLATVIDHGWGVYSGYWHQSAIEVSVGQTVEAGQRIGAIGDSGRVTGPHLHWEIFVGGVQVDPMQWTEMAFP